MAKARIFRLEDNELKELAELKKYLHTGNDNASIKEIIMNFRRICSESKKRSAQVSRLMALFNTIRHDRKKAVHNCNRFYNEILKRKKQDLRNLNLFNNFKLSSLDKIKP
jgi:hypothetical protein